MTKKTLIKQEMESLMKKETIHSNLTSDKPLLKSMLDEARNENINAQLNSYSEEPNSNSTSLEQSNFEREFNKFDREFNKFDREFNKFDRENS